jgi:outer membrane protein assembly factor BamB
LGGVSACDDITIVACRDLLDRRDFFQAIDSKSGRPRWQVHQPCQGEMDYGRAPRATPLILDDRVILLSAFGHLHCVQRATGLTIWKHDLVNEYQAPLPTWGFSGTPLAFDDQLVVQVGSPIANLVSFNIADGVERWREGKEQISYSSFVAANPNGIEQLIGLDKVSIGGWSPTDGHRLWTITPELSGDFNVPTPIVRDDLMWLVSENNGLRLYRFENGVPSKQPLHSVAELCPDSHTPVVVGNRLFVAFDGLHCLDALTLKTIWYSDAEHLMGYASLIGSESRLLVLTQSGALTLFDISGPQPQELGSRQLGSDIDFQSHPAYSNGHLFVRVGKSLACYRLIAA